MKTHKILIALVLILFSLESFCQSPEKVEMADVLRQDGKIYTVVFGLIIILTAVIVLLIRVDRKLSRMENQGKKQ